MTEKFMKAAIKCAEKALDEGEVPIGAVVVCDGKIISRGHNRRTKKQIATAHAEIEAIEKACKKLKSWRIPECEIYVTLEPCPMCAGAAVNARIQRIIYGLDDPAAGCCGSAADVTHLSGAHQVELYRGCMEDQCRALMRQFFQSLRLSKPGAGMGDTLP